MATPKIKASKPPKPMITVRKPFNWKKWGLLGAGGVAAVASGAFLYEIMNGGKEEEVPEVPEKIASEEPAVDPNQIYFQATVLTPVFQNLSEKSEFGFVRKDECVVLVGEKGKFTTAHFLGSKGEVTPGYVDASRFKPATDLPKDDKGKPICIGNIEGPMIASESFYVVSVAKGAPLYKDASKSGPVLMHLEEKSCVILAGQKDAIRPVIARVGQNAPIKGYIDFAGEYGVFSHATSMTEDKCEAFVKPPADTAKQAPAKPATPDVPPPLNIPKPAPSQ